MRRKIVTEQSFEFDANRICGSSAAAENFSYSSKISRRARQIFVWSSLLLCASFALGCGDSSRNEAGQQQPKNARATVKETTADDASPAVQIYEDEAMLKGSQAIIGGTVENVAGERLESLTVELELRRRKDNQTEVRALEIVPPTLAPGERGRYTLTLPSNQWSGSRILRLRSATRGEDIAYKSQVGARRPPERIPDTRKVIVEPRPTRPRRDGEEFINTPDNPERIP